MAEREGDETSGSGGDVVRYRSETNGVVVEVAPQFVPEESAPEQPLFVWRYAIRIANHSEKTVRLLRRYWRLTDCRGQVDEVRGDGVVGQQPTLRPGDAFEYESYAPLRAPSGVMGGWYEMVAEDGAPLTVETPHFSLDSPYDAPRLN